MQLLQKILMPKKDVCNIQDMYYRTNDAVVVDNDTLFLRTGNSVSFDTYFNSFSIGKWKKYTIIDNVSISFMFKGELSLYLYHLSLNNNGNVIKKYIMEKKIKSLGQTAIVNENFGTSCEIGLFAFEIKAISDVKINNIKYVSNITNKRNNKLALCFCTYKREEFILNNIRKIKEGIIDNHNSVLNDNIDIFVSDNGQTLPNVNLKCINIFKNNNYGGVGGFTRTIIESVFNSEKIYDYVILCDDDILLDCRILENTFLFSCFLKNEYLDNMIGGALLSLEEKSFQVENGACFQNVKICRNHGLNMRSLKSIIENEKSEILAEYNGWFYCCIPTRIINSNNLPLPIFIHCDDIEYGLRNSREIITMNGICVWHPTVIGKDPLWMEYYNSRNHRIIMKSLNRSIGLFSEICNIVKCCIIALVRYRYLECHVKLKAISDFYLGAETFSYVDPEIQHKELSSSYKYEWFEYTDTYGISYETNKRKQYLLGLLNYLFPAFINQKVILNGNPYYSTFITKKICVFDKYNRKAYLLKKDYKAALICIALTSKTLFEIIRNYKKAQLSWSHYLPLFKSLKFWHNYLHLKYG